MLLVHSRAGGPGPQATSDGDLGADTQATGAGTQGSLLTQGSLPPPVPSQQSGVAPAPRPQPPGPPCRRASHPAPQQLVGRDAQGPPVHGVRVPGASVHAHLEHLGGCQRQDGENVTARLASHSLPLREGRGDSDHEARTPSAVPPAPCPRKLGVGPRKAAGVSGNTGVATWAAGQWVARVCGGGGGWTPAPQSEGQPREPEHLVAREPHQHAEWVGEV